MISGQEYVTFRGNHFNNKCGKSNEVVVPIKPTLPSIMPSKQHLLNGNSPATSICDRNKQSIEKRDDQLEEPKKVLYPMEMVKLGWRNPPSKRSGMINLGNTCYLNSTLQVSFHFIFFFFL